MISKLDSLACGTLKLFSHRRNRLTETEIAARTREQPYNPSKARKHISFFSKHLDFSGKSVVDIGCGYGDLLIGLAKAGIERGLGVDLDPVRVECARKNARAEGVADRLQFECADFVKEYDTEDRFDLALSIGSFEHILDPGVCLRRIHDLLEPGGSLATRFGPLWWSPYGAHMFDFTPMPWVHVLFPESVVLRVRKEYFRPDQAVERYEDIVGHLNRMTVGGFKKHAAGAGFTTRVFRVNPEKDWKWGGALRPLNSIVNALPVVREAGALTLLAILDRC